MADPLSFERLSLGPVDCIRQGIELSKKNFGLLLGVCLIAMFFFYVPIILVAPALCGLHICFDNVHRNRTSKVEDLFKGFDYLSSGLIITLLMMGIFFLISILFTALFLGAVGGLAYATRGLGNVQGAIVGIACVLLYIGMFVVSILAGMPFVFAYPLLVDRGLQPMEAVSLSWRAVRANLFPLIGVYLTVALAAFVGTIATCFVGSILLMPVMWATYHIVYRNVFPAMQDEPPPLPTEG